MRGSKEPDAPTDEMCAHCGLYYSNRGIKEHERNCDREDPILPLDRHEDGEHPADQGGPEAPTPSDGGGTGDDPAGSAEIEEPTDPDPATATDGGTAGLGLDGPPEPSDDPPADPDGGEPETVDCPTCGADTGLTPDEHDDGTVYRADCGHRYRWSA